MVNYAQFDKDGSVIAFYSEEVFGQRYIDIEGKLVENFDCKIPDDAIEITEEQYFNLLEKQSYARFIDGKVIEYTPQPPLPIIPDEISRRQFFQHLANLEIISRAEALAAIQTGSIPAPMQTIIDNLSNDDAKFEAMMLVAGATVFNRNNPLADIVNKAMNWTDEQKDKFWLEAAKL